jgi:hypothetical protein
MRIRYEKELANNKFTAKLGYIRDCFLERPIYIGVIIYKKIQVSNYKVFVITFSLTSCLLIIILK